MTITREEVNHVATLARLDIDEGDETRFAGQIADILEHINALNDVDTGGVPPTAGAYELKNAFREDVVGNPLDREAALANAPDRDEACFVVPKVVG